MCEHPTPRQGRAMRMRVSGQWRVSCTDDASISSSSSASALPPRPIRSKEARTCARATWIDSVRFDKTSCLSCSADRRTRSSATKMCGSGSLAVK
eukprot:scaffold17819_cov120-Isochrysis_galbana.AAC.4